MSDKSLQQIRALLFEDDPADAVLFEAMIEGVDGVNFSTNHVATLADGISALKENDFDLILLDLHLTDSHGLETFDAVQTLAEDTPIIILSGLDDDETAFEAVRRGAQDFLIKGTMNSDLLIRALRHAIERFKLSKLQEDVQRAQIELEISKKTTHHFLSNISHELRTPLTATIGYLQLLNQSGNLSDEQREYLNKATENNSRLQAVVRDVIEMSRIQSDQLKLETSPFEFDVVWTRIEKKYRAKAREKLLRFDTDIDDIGILYTDQEKLGYILTAIIDNAVKFTQRGMVHIKIKILDEELHFAVTDTGCGIPEYERAHVFDAFQNDLNYLSQEGRSMGLGLAISSSFLEMMGGRVEIQSDSNGSTFNVTIPNVGYIEPECVDTGNDADLVAALKLIDEDHISGLETTVLQADPEAFRSLLQTISLPDTLRRNLLDSMGGYEFDRLLNLLSAAR